MDKQSPTQQHTEYTNARIKHLQEQYLTQTPLPGTDTTPLTPVQFYHLLRAIMAEGYGH